MDFHTVAGTFSRFRGARFAVAGAVLLFFTATLCSAEWTPAQPGSSTSSSSVEIDCRLTVLARQALYQDETLAPLNLGVSVRNHVATLWGPVASAALSRRAANRLRSVPGIENVVNQLVVEDPRDPLVEFLKTPRPRKLTPVLEAPGVDGSRPAGSPSSRVTTAPKPVPVAVLAEREIRQGATPSRLSSLESERKIVVTMPTIPLPTPPANSVSLDELIQSVEHLRQGNVRLSRVRAEVEAGTVRLRGSVQSWEDLFELARGISLLPGVERVILQDVKTERR